MAHILSVFSRQFRHKEPKNKKPPQSLAKALFMRETAILKAMPEGRFELPTKGL